MQSSFQCDQLIGAEADRLAMYDVAVETLAEPGRTLAEELTGKS